MCLRKERGPQLCVPVPQNRVLVGREEKEKQLAGMKLTALRKRTAGRAADTATSAVTSSRRERDRLRDKIVLRSREREFAKGCWISPSWDLRPGMSGGTRSRLLDIIRENQ